VAWPAKNHDCGAGQDAGRHHTKTALNDKHSPDRLAPFLRHPIQALLGKPCCRRVRVFALHAGQRGCRVVPAF